MTKHFAVGDRVVKPNGYKFDGVVRAVFQNYDGDTRYVVEYHGDGKMLHIFSRNQIALHASEYPCDRCHHKWRNHRTEIDLNTFTVWECNVAVGQGDWCGCTEAMPDWIEPWPYAV